MLHLQQETVRLRREIDWMRTLQAERRKQHDRRLARLRAPPPLPLPCCAAADLGPRLAPPPWSDTLLRLSWCGDHNLLLSAAFYDARPPAERDTPSADCCDRLADVVRTTHPHRVPGLEYAMERRLPTLTETEPPGVRWISLFYVRRRDWPYLPTLADALWQHLQGATPADTAANQAEGAVVQASP